MKTCTVTRTIEINATYLVTSLESLKDLVIMEGRYQHSKWGVHFTFLSLPYASSFIARVISSVEEEKVKK